MTVRSTAVLVLVAGLLPLSGCGDKFAEVTGTVSLKGQPLESGIVSFFPESGAPVAAFIEKGSYTIPVVGYGTHKISVTPVVGSPEVSTAGGKSRKPGEVDPTAKAGAPKKESGPPIPQKYRSIDTSGLTAKVDQPKQTISIDLD